MKKTFSRALSLLLVLVMVIGVMPMALAAGSVTVSGDAALEVGETGTYTAAVVLPGEGWTASYAWEGATGNGATATLTPTAAGNVTVSCEVTFTKEGEQNQTATGTFPVTVTAPTVPATGLVLTVDKTIIYGGSDPAILDVTASPDNAEIPDGLQFIYDSSVVTVSNAGVVKGKNVGTTTIVATAGGLTSNAVTVQVKYTKANLEGGQPTMSLVVGEDEEMGVYATPSAAGATISYKSSNTNVATVDRTGVVVAKSAGQAIITATMTLPYNSQYELGVSTLTTTVTVREGGYIECDDVNTTNGYAIVTPVVYYNGYAVSNATFTYTATSNLQVTTQDGGRTFYVSRSNYSTSDSGTITFTANNFYAPYTNALVTGTSVGTKTVRVSFFSGNTLNVNLADNASNFYFSNRGVAESATIGYTNVYNASNYSLYEMIGQAIDVTGSYSSIARWEFNVSSTSGGYLTYGNSTTGLSVPYQQLGSVRFIQKSSTNKTTVFTVSAVSSSGATLGQLYVTLNAGEGTSAIEYSTTAGKAVTFKTADFATYWNTMSNISYSNYYDDDYYNTSSNTTNYGTLSYVVFGTPSSGTLYANTAKTARATTSTRFVYSSTNTNTSTTTYPLSGVTFVPGTSTAQYSVEIPFTAYGTTGRSITGTVLVKVNESSSTVGARGVSLSSVATSIAETYYTSTRQSLGFVVFELPSAQQATIYRSIPEVGGYNRVADASRAQTGDRFVYGGSYNYNYNYNNSYNNNYNNYYGGSYNSPYYDYTNSNNNGYYNNNYNTGYNSYSSAQYPLDAASVVPAAGFSGKLTLKYTAYTANGSNPYNGSITLTIQSQTASKVFNDVTASSYSWAADAVDFLYYEGVAQGSNNRYNPKANITRGDFMLMLYRAFLEEDYDTHSVTSNFSDVVKGNDSYSQEIYQAVGVAKYLGIAQGTNGKYNPKANITREEAMVLIYRTLDEVNRTLRYKSGTSASSFTDYKNISSWATNAISSLVGNGVIQGTNNKVNPKANITRAEMACILHRVITY